jgi:hypothetical protein
MNEGEQNSRSRKAKPIKKISSDLDDSEEP